MNNENFKNKSYNLRKTVEYSWFGLRDSCKMKNFIQKILLLSILLIIMSSTVNLYGDSTSADFEKLIETADYNYDLELARKLLPEVENHFSKKSHLYYYYTARIYEIITSSTDQRGRERNKNGEEFADKSIENIEKALLIQPNHSDSHRIYSVMLARKVYGAATGIIWDAITVKELEIAIKLDENNFKAQLQQAQNYLERPLKYGGDRDAGLALLKKLHEINSENSKVLYFMSRYYKIKNDSTKRKEYLKQALETNPNELLASWDMKEFEIQEEKLTIKEFRVKNKTKTKTKKIMKIVDKYKNSLFDEKTKNSIIDDLSWLQSIDDATFSYKKEEGELVIDMNIAEDNTSIINILAGTFFSLDYDRDINLFEGEAPGAVYATFYYETNNLFGTANKLSITSMVVYNDIFYQHYLKLFDIRARINANVIPGDALIYKDGSLLKPGYNAMDPIGELGVGKSFDFGLDIFLMQQFKWNFSIDIQDGYTAPKETLTSSTYLDIRFESIAYHEQLWLMDGYFFELRNELIHKPGYQTWGWDTIVDEQHEHNNKPMFKLFAHLGVFKRVAEQLEFRQDISYMYSTNSYFNELHTVGKGMFPDILHSKLRGFYQVEFRTSNALITNSFFSFPIIKEHLRLGVFYDTGFFFDGAGKDTFVFKHGTGFQILAKFPWDININFQTSFGINADRNQGPGVEFDFYVSKLFLF